MSLHRVDHMVLDDHGRPVRRVTRYVERRGGAARPVAVPLAPATPGAVEEPTPGAPAVAASVALVPPDAPPAIDLEETETVRGLRAALADLQAKAAQLEQAAVDHAGAPPAAIDPAVLAGLTDGLALLGTRIGAIEDVLAALAAAAAEVAGAEEPLP